MELTWTDTFAPGWRAEFNGSPTELVQFERLFSRIKLPAAQGTVRLTYHPAGEGPLRWLAGGIALSCGGALVLGMVRKRPETSPA